MNQPAFENQRGQMTLESQRPPPVKILLAKETKPEKQGSESTITRPEIKQSNLSSNVCQDEESHQGQVKRDFLNVMKKQFPQ